MAGAAQRFVVGEFGGSGDSEEVTVSVGTTAVRVLENDPDRVMFLLVNNGTGPVYLSTAPTITAPNGAAVQGSGGNMEVDVREDGSLVSREWWAVSSSGTQSCTVFSTRVFNLAPSSSHGVT